MRFGDANQQSFSWLEKGNVNYGGSRIKKNYEGSCRWLAESASCHIAPWSSRCRREKFPILIELYILTLGIFCFTKGFNENLEDYYEELNANFGCKSLMSDFDNHGHSYLYLYSLPNSYCFKSYCDKYYKSKCIYNLRQFKISNGVTLHKLLNARNKIIKWTHHLILHINVEAIKYDLGGCKLSNKSRKNYHSSVWIR